MMGDALICFSCCIADQPQPKNPRRRIDPTMIGLPTDFRHTGHIGAGEVAHNNAVTIDAEKTRLNSMQSQMSSKGGYSHISPVDVHLNVIDLPNNSDTDR